MSESVVTRGSCLCTKVRINVPNIDQKVLACRCEKCRRWGSGPRLSVDCGDAPVFEGNEHIAVYQSSESADRGFCKECGSHLFYRVKKSGVYFVPIGIFNKA